MILEDSSTNRSRFTHETIKEGGNKEKCVATRQQHIPEDVKRQQKGGEHTRPSQMCPKNVHGIESKYKKNNNIRKTHGIANRMGKGGMRCPMQEIGFGPDGAAKERFIESDSASYYGP